MASVTYTPKGGVLKLTLDRTGDLRVIEGSG